MNDAPADQTAAWALEWYLLRMARPDIAGEIDWCEQKMMRLLTIGQPILIEARQ